MKRHRLADRGRRRRNGSRRSPRPPGRSAARRGRREIASTSAGVALGRAPRSRRCQPARLPSTANCGAAPVSLQQHALAAGVAIGAIGQHEGALVPADPIDAAGLAAAAARSTGSRQASSRAIRLELRIRPRCSSSRAIVLAGAGHHRHRHGASGGRCRRGRGSPSSRPQDSPSPLRVSASTSSRDANQTHSLRDLAALLVLLLDQLVEAGASACRAGGTAPGSCPGSRRPDRTARPRRAPPAIVSSVQPSGSGSARSQPSGAPSGTVTIRTTLAPASLASFATLRANARPGSSSSGQISDRRGRRAAYQSVLCGDCAPFMGETTATIRKQAIGRVGRLLALDDEHRRRRVAPADCRQPVERGRPPPAQPFQCQPSRPWRTP